jgi:predicted enzyme related to lactoylglutathione lyase
MPTGPELGGPAIVRISLAVVDMPRAVQFYDTVLRAELASVGSHGMYQGTLGGVPLLLVPNDLADLVPGRSMHMLRFAVQDLDATIAAAVSAGGSVVNEPAGEPGSRLAAVSDTDDNVIELTEG